MLWQVIKNYISYISIHFCISVYIFKRIKKSLKEIFALSCFLQCNRDRQEDERNICIDRRMDEQNVLNAFGRVILYHKKE